MACTTQVVQDASRGERDTGAAREQSLTLIVFGATGDLAKRKLLPALFQLAEAGLLPEQLAVIGFSRSALSDDAFRAQCREALADAGLAKQGAQGSTQRLLDALFYVAGDNDDPAAFTKLAARVTQIEEARGLSPNRLAYLSVSPEFFATIVRNLTASGILQRAPLGGSTAQAERGFSRVVVEKPFGRDLASARALNAALTHELDESQIYRIDHYLGKETVQNIFSFRFGNAIFEPLFNQKYVEHVAITVAETLGMEGKRGAYYDHAGATRDMLQNHVLQLLSIVAMEPPSSMDAAALRAEKVKVLRSLVPMTRERAQHDSVRGQYGAGEQNQDGQRIKGYREEQGVAARSNTETFVALKLAVDNWRWASVPFYVRTGKRLAARTSEIAVTFKRPPLHLFKQLACPDALAVQHSANVLILRIQPNEGIGLTFQAKTPGMRMCLDQVRMDFSYTAFGKRSPEAYERLLLDAIHGDASLFTHRDEVEEAWRFVGSLQEAWSELPAPSYPNYAPFSAGPAEQSRLFAGTDHAFRPLTEP
jgi:glucose-6-phosphate 1-dehydrogenase